MHDCSANTYKVTETKGWGFPIRSEIMNENVQRVSVIDSQLSDLHSSMEESLSTLKGQRT